MIISFSQYSFCQTYSFSKLVEFKVLGFILQILVASNQNEDLEEN